MTSWLLERLVLQVRDLLGPDLPITTDIPSNQTAWLAVPVFAAAKRLGRPLPELAQEVADKLYTIPNVEVSIDGGFVNVRPTNRNQALLESLDPAFPSSQVGSGRTIVIEFSQPNVAKPMHVGHLRSTIIGSTLCRLYESLGYTVIGTNYLGDWGTQYGKLVVAYQQKYGDLEPRPEIGIPELLELYVQFHVEAEEKTELDEQARAVFKQLEDGDPAVRKLWEFFVTISLAEFQKTYDRLGITFTEPKVGESTYRALFEPVAEQARERGIVEQSDGAEIVRVEGIDTPFMLRKRDGATTYGARDLATLKHRVDTYQPERLIYVVANDQSLHFEQVFAVTRLLGLAPESTQLRHVKFGLIRLPEGKMSTRKGRVIFLEDVFDEVVSRARQAVEQKNPDLDEAQKQQIAEIVGIGALKYFDLSHDAKHDIVFDWDRMLQLAGDSGPYLQYSYVRAVQILAKAGELPTDVPAIDIPADVVQLVRELARFPLVVQKAAEGYAPHTIAQYLNDVATQFSRFYEKYPVLQAEGDERTVRLAVTTGVANVLKRGLALLGIQVLDRM